MKKITVSLVLAAAVAAAQDLSMGVLPFVDATAATGGDAGLMVARTVQAELLRGTRFTGRILALPDGIRAEHLDQAKALEIGNAQHVDYVLLGTILRAGVEESSRSGWSPSIVRQSAGLSVRSAKGAVMLQGVLYRVKTGERVATLRVEGKSAQRKIGASAYTSLGHWDNNNQLQFMDSPLGKAVTEAVENLVREVIAAAAQ